MLQLRTLVYICRMVTIEITLQCPHCNSTKVIKNGRKGYADKQNYLCKNCRKQFIADNERQYNGRKVSVKQKIKKMLVRGCGVRDIAEIEQVSLWTVLASIAAIKEPIPLHNKHYDTIEIDELWSYVGNKKNKKWLIYAYCRKTGEIVGYVWGRRNKWTVKRLRKQLQERGITFKQIAMDKWESFMSVFSDCKCLIGKEFTVGIEGNNCLIRHRVRRLFRRTCCFSKKEENHYKCFDLWVQYHNFGVL